MQHGKVAWIRSAKFYVGVSVPSATAVHQVIINPRAKDKQHDRFNHPHRPPNRVRAFAP
jgi:hypothetical protein